MQMTLFHSFYGWVIVYCVCLYLCIYHIFFIHSNIHQHLGYFCVLAIVNSAAINTGVHVSFWIIVFSEDMLRRGIAESYGNSIFSFFKEPPYCSPWWLFHFHQVLEYSFFPQFSPGFFICRLFYCSHFLFHSFDYDHHHGVIPRCSFNLKVKENESVSHSVVSNSLWPHGLYVAHQVPLYMGCSRQEHWSG